MRWEARSKSPQAGKAQVKWGMDSKQTDLPVLVLWQTLPSLQPSKKAPASLTSRRQKFERMGRAKAAFISLLALIKVKSSDNSHM